MENTTRTPCSQQRTHEIQDTIFGEHVLFSFFYSREKILCVHIFFIRGRKFYALVSFMTFLFVIKKDLKIRFFKHGAVVNTRRSVLTYLYIIYYIKRTERRKHPKGITIHTVSF